MSVDINNNIASDIQGLDLGKLVSLYELDLTNIGSTDIYYFTESIDSDYTPVIFDGTTYTPIDMESSGWEYSGEGDLPRPKISVSNVTKYLFSAVITYEDLVGAILTRRRTFEKYLDGKSEANPAAEFPKDIFVIERKTSHNKFLIEWELAAYMDFQGVYIPKRQVLRETCTHAYRVPSGSSFNYTNASCPFTDEFTYSFFDRTGDRQASNSDDVCGKRLVDCKLRFFKDAGGTKTISDTAPGSPSPNDMWLDTSVIPNIWKVYRDTGDGPEWKVSPSDQLPTWAFPSVSKTRA